MDDLTNEKGKYISWQTLAMMAFVTVIGLEDIMYNFQNQGMAVITSWFLMMFLYVVPYALIVGHLGSVFNKEGGGLSSWVRATDGEFLGYFTAWTYWAASIPYVVDTANCLLVDVGWGLTGTDEFEDPKFLSTAMFTAITFLIFIILTLIEHKFSESMEILANIGGWAMFVMTILFVLLAMAGLAKSGGRTATPFTWKTIIPKFDLKYFSTVGMLIYAVNGSELVAPYVTRMKDPKREFPKAMIALAVMTCFLTIFGSIALGIYIDANHMPNDLKMNGEYYVFGAMGKQFGVGNLLVYIYAWSSFFYNVALLSVLLDAMTRMLISDTGDKYMPKFLKKTNKDGLPINGYILTVFLSGFIMVLGIFLPDMNDIFNWLLNLNGIISPAVTCWIFYSFMKVRGKNSKKYPSVYRYIKNDTVAWLVGLALLVVTAVATVLGFMPQDVKEGTWVWWYELSINIVACLVLIGLGGIFPGIRRREEEYGLAFDKQQWTWMIVLILGSITFNVWLGGTKIHLRALYIVIESVIALLAVWLIGRRVPQGAKKTTTAN
ncbi:Amino acid permease [Lactobacillus equicursoris DSM 19284 = JCM 14600 = CIP 110162]|uniref:Amino acid permease n=1 Tax=Lactobacillus equicursoris DSM 19284 = JCM 14600 = CIP 110162 TaxID=1293597 RepID=K0NKG3_9LACO|nr:APC family permease [Lactobacillus equicursoris]KRL03780.1 amino acid permease [Lactobacillus equicursoris DSM 19284 = JCM 14600 = CIP 110162]CCK85772.1 Amino acid permease [Lactobacillus equicursoris DSM 19284 = JCM 14600 = CIP 110162]